MKGGNRDTLFSTSESEITKFSFDENVVDVFDDMIHRSLPGYDAVLAMIGVLAERYAKEGSQCYDLGCSLGAVTFSMIKQIKDQACHFIAVDSSEAMIARLRKKIADAGLQSKVEVRLEDIRDTSITKASVVVLNFVLQFLDPEQRMPLLEKIYNGMLPGSILVLSEKINFSDKKEDEFQIDMHHEFKKLQGYSDLEISRKRAALENVLQPDSLEKNMQRLQTIGFKETYLWFQCFNFSSIVAIK